MKVTARVGFIISSTNSARRKMVAHLLREMLETNNVCCISLEEIFYSQEYGSSEKETQSISTQLDKLFEEFGTTGVLIIDGEVSSGGACQAITDKFDELNIAPEARLGFLYDYDERLFSLLQKITTFTISGSIDTAGLGSQADQEMEMVEQLREFEKRLVTEYVAL